VGEAPSFAEMDSLLRNSEEFSRLDIPPMGYYKSLSYIRDSLGLFDAHPANCVVGGHGHLIPIDFILVELEENARKILMNRIL
jgi:hypothetical protein